MDRADEVPARTALGIGLAQVLSLIPGTSRSGATIMGGYALGLSRKAATEFSFFLAIPVMLAATLYDLLKSLDALTAADVPAFAVGFVVSFLTALVVVKAFLAYVSRHSFAAFAWYRIVVRRAPAAVRTLSEPPSSTGSSGSAPPWICCTSWRRRGRRRAPRWWPTSRPGGEARAGGPGALPGRALAQRAVPAAVVPRGRAPEPPAGPAVAAALERPLRGCPCAQVAQRPHAGRPQARRHSVRGPLAGRERWAGSRSGLGLNVAQRDSGRAHRHGHGPRRAPVRMSPWRGSCPGSSTALRGPVGTIRSGSRPRSAASWSTRDWLCGRELRAPLAGRAEGIADDGPFWSAPTERLAAVRAGTVELAERSRTR